MNCATVACAHRRRLPAIFILPEETTLRRVPALDVSRWGSSVPVVVAVASVRGSGSLHPGAAARRVGVAPHGPSRATSVRVKGPAFR